MGWNEETWFAGQARNRGLSVSLRTRVRAPFDLTVEGWKVDVKTANAAQIANGLQWTWRIAKEAHVSDFYALIARGAGDPILLIIPAEHVPLTCMTMRSGSQSMKDRGQWRDRWDLFNTKE